MIKNFSLDLLFIICLFLIKTSFAQETDPYRLNHKAEPTFQFIHLDLDPDKEDYSGSTRIELEIKESISSFRLHGRDFEISKMVLLRDNKPIISGFEFQDYGLLKINPTKELQPGKYSLEFEFEGKISRKGEGISWFEKDSINYLYTQMQDIFARRFFPCFDEPNFKFPYQVEITASKDLLVVSNTLAEKETIKGNNKTVRFKKTKPIPSYLIAFAVGPYETTPIPDLSIPGRIILPMGYLEKSHFIKENTAQILASLEDYFGMTYPYEKLDMIAVSNYNYGAMENPGLVVYWDAYFIESAELSKTFKYYFASITAHELAHMWFGDLVTMHWWNDTWLNEGFASWLGEEIVLKEFPELNAMEGLYSSFKFALRDDKLANASSIIRPIKGSENPLETFDNLTYLKSQIVLRMLEHWMGRDDFRKGLSIYLEKYKWQNTTSDNLFESLASVTDKPIQKFIKAFVTKPGVPLISADINGNSITLKQERLKTAENSEKYNTIWPIPVNLKIYDGQKIFKTQVLLEKAQDTFVFDQIEKIDWLHLKENVNGYYTWLTPEENVIKAVQSGMLTPTETEDMFSGLLYGLEAGKIDPVNVLKLAQKLKSTDDLAVIIGLTTLVNNIYESFGETVPQSKFTNYINQTMTPMLYQIGAEHNLSLSNSTGTAQSSLIRLLYDNQEIRQKVLDLANGYFLEKELANYWKYLTALGFWGDEKLYENVKSKLENSSNSFEQRVLAYTLAMFPEQYAEKTLDYALKQKKDPFLTIYIPRNLQVNLHRRKLRYGSKSSVDVLQWVKGNEELIKNNVAEVSLEYSLPIMITDRTSLETFNRLFPASSRTKTLNQKIEKRKAMIERNEKLADLYAEGILTYLSKFNTSISAEN